MKKNPIHFYWGRKNGLVVTREDAEGNHPSWPDCSCSGASADWYAALRVIIKKRTNPESV